MSEPQKPALVELAANNEIVVIQDTDHKDDRVSAAIDAQLSGMAAKGVKHLFLEHDAHDHTVQDIVSQPGAYAQMVRHAQALGMEIHLMDDRSRQRDYAVRYPEEQAYVNAHDVYRERPDALIAGAPNPEKMKAYLAERQQNEASDLAFRNVRMVENIADEMQRHPGEKAAAMPGSAHVDKKMDVDEGLRLRGYQTATAQIHLPDAVVGAPDSHAFAKDKADMVIDSTTGFEIAYKVPGTNMMRAMTSTPSGGELPWANREPVSDRNHPAMLCAMNAAKEVQCSWNHGLNKSEIPHFTAGETGKMASPSTQRQAASPEPDGPPR